MKCEGEKIGIGKAEALQISTEMLRDSESAAKISKYSGLSAEECEKMRTDLSHNPSHQF